MTYIYGIGRTSSNRILADAGVDPNTRVRDLTDEEVKKIASVIEETQTVEGDLRRQTAMDIKRLMEIGCYRGIRHRKGLLSEAEPGEAGAGVPVGLRCLPVFDRVLAGRRRARRHRAPVLLPMGERLHPRGAHDPRHPAP